MSHSKGYQPKKIFGKDNPRYVPTSPATSLSTATVTSFRDDFPHPMLISEPPEKELTEDFCYEVSEWVLDNVKDHKPIFATIHGSYLYGTAHDGSDVDLYVVVE